MPKVFLASDSQFTEILKIWPGCVGDAFESKLYPWMVNNAEVFLLLFIVNDEVDFLPWRLCRSLSKFFFSSTRNIGWVVEHLVRIFLFVGPLSKTVRRGTWREGSRDDILLYRSAKICRRCIFSSMFSARSKPESYKLDILFSVVTAGVGPGR